MGGVYGVKNTIEAVDLGLSIGVAVKNARADGTIDAADVVHLIPAVAKVGPAVADAALIPKEVGELDAEDATQIVASVQSRLPELGDARAVAIAGKSLAVAVAVAELVSEIRKSDGVA